MSKAGIQIDIAKLAREVGKQFNSEQDLADYRQASEKDGRRIGAMC